MYWAEVGPSWHAVRPGRYHWETRCGKRLLQGWPLMTEPGADVCRRCAAWARLDEAIARFRRLVRNAA